MRCVIHETRPFPSLDLAWQASGHRDASGAPAQAPTPGAMLPGPRGRLLVSAGEGSVIEILRLQEEGRRVLTAREWMAGRSLPPGASFSLIDPA